MYLDSCIIVKLLTVEPDSEFFVQALLGNPLVTSELAETEVFSALLARERIGHLTTATRQRAWRTFDSLRKSGELRIVPLNSVVLSKARQALERCHPKVALRTLDAIHLATSDIGQVFPLVTTDSRLRDAAALMGIDVFPLLTSHRHRCKCDV